MSDEKTEFLIEKLLDVCENISDSQIRLNESLIVAGKDHEHLKETVDKIKESQWIIRDTLLTKIEEGTKDVPAIKATTSSIKDKDKFTRKLIVVIGSITTALAGFLTFMKLYFEK